MFSSVFLICVSACSRPGNDHNSSKNEISNNANDNKDDNNNVITIIGIIIRVKKY